MAGVTFPKRLPVEPFARWLNEYARVTCLEPADLAFSLRLVPRRVQSYRYRSQEWVAFDVVDRALTNSSRIVVLDGVPVFGLEDLYPMLSVEDAA